MPPIDPWILSFSAITVLGTIWLGFRSAGKSKTASDFFVAGRNVSVGWNASAISGEYLSAASFMGIAGMVMSSGYDALWYPVCYACGYLFLLLFIAGPLRRFGAYTIPDFAEGRFDSPVFRKIAVVFVLFIGLFYTMPQMKGAGTTLAYIFPGLPYWAGVVLVGAVITLNVALGGMKGITLVQAFQYWLKMFAISVPIFVLMTLYGHYGRQVGINGGLKLKPGKLYQYVYTAPSQSGRTAMVSNGGIMVSMTGGPTFQKGPTPRWKLSAISWLGSSWASRLGIKVPLSGLPGVSASRGMIQVKAALNYYGQALNKTVSIAADYWALEDFVPFPRSPIYGTKFVAGLEDAIREANMVLIEESDSELKFASRDYIVPVTPALTDVPFVAPQFITLPKAQGTIPLHNLLSLYGELTKRAVILPANAQSEFPLGRLAQYFNRGSAEQAGQFQGAARVEWLKELKANIDAELFANGMRCQPAGERAFWVDQVLGIRQPLPDNAPKDDTWLAPFGPLTTKAAKAAARALANQQTITLRADMPADQHMTVNLDDASVPRQLAIFSDLTGRKFIAETNDVTARWDEAIRGKLGEWNLVSRPPEPDNGIRLHRDGALTAAEVKAIIEARLRTNGIALVPAGKTGFTMAPVSGGAGKEKSGNAAQAWLDKYEKPLALLYTYSLIIAIVCGTAGLPHILVRFYTNPNGVAAKRTTLWVMILIGTFYIFPPVFGVMGRNLVPSLYTGTGAKGTDKVVLELPKVLDAHNPQPSNPSPARPFAGSPSRSLPWGSILSGITCAGAFAAFMSTFSGLLVSMTGALAHDVYGRMLRPNATAEQRLRMFRIAAVLLGGIAIIAGTFVEPFQINFMVGQAFAIAAASYFPLLFMAVWWRGLTMKGAATGMLAGGLLALTGISLTSFSDLKWIDLADFWALHPLVRILCEQPAIWAVPLAITLMVIVSKFTAREIPSDVRMKMLVLHAPEELGLKQEYIQEHAH